MLCNTYKMTVGLMHSVTLYHWEPNANSGKPMLALMEKGVAFESHYLDLLKFDQHQPDYLAINPQGTIPAMVHGERVLTESTAIMEYVNEEFRGPRLMPEDPRDRWRVRWWMKFMDQWLGPSFSMIGWKVFVGPAVSSRDPGELQAAIARIPLPERRVAWRKAIYGEFGEGSSRSPSAAWRSASACWSRSLRSGRGSPAIRTASPTSTGSILPMRCRCPSRRCPTTS